VKGAGLDFTPGAKGGPPADPQTFNRYGYVRNSPLHITDPTGMEDDGSGCDPDIDPTCDGNDPRGGGGGDGSGPTTSDPCTGNPGLCDPGDPCQNPYAATCSNPFGGNGPIGWGDGNAGPVGPSDGDPCAYLNASGTGVESTDYNSSPGECSSTGGVWYPDGGSISVSPDGMGPTVSAAGFCGAVDWAGGYVTAAAAGAWVTTTGGSMSQQRLLDHSNCRRWDGA
jgi:hypothetical protein